MQKIRSIKPTGCDWLAQVFQCQAMRSSRVIRRQVIDVKREVGVNAFVAEVGRRRFRLIRTDTHFVIICNDGPIELVIWRSTFLEMCCALLAHLGQFFL